MARGVDLRAGLGRLQSVPDMKRLSLLSLVFCLFPLAATVGCSVQGGTAAPASDHAMTGLLVQGSGKSVAQPDQATVNFGVMMRARSAQEARTGVDQKMRAVIQAVASYGVPKEQVQTTNVSLYEERDHREGPRPTKASPEGGKVEIQALPSVHYVARNQVSIKVTDLSRLGAILSAVTQAGVNQMHGVEFGLQDSKPHQAKARQLAIVDARNQAQQMAQAAGVRLGRIISMQASQDGGYGTHRAFAAMAHSKESSTPTEAGSLEIQERVSIRYEILK